MTKPALERLRELPQTEAVWEGGFVRLPLWTGEPGAQPFRPSVFLWLSVETGILGPGREAVVPADDREDSIALDTLIRFAIHEMGGSRPTRLEVNDEAVAAYLTEALQELDTEVVHRKNLAMWESELRSLWKFILERDLLPGYVEGRDVTVDRVRAFAEAAQAFRQAEPWRKLSNVDLIKIESPRPRRAPRYVIVLGAGGCEFGLTFCQSVSDFWSYRGDSESYARTTLENGVWSVTFIPVVELPLADADLWEDHDLPVDDPGGYPLAAQYFPNRVRRPSAQMLSYFEGILRALARTGDEELCQGRWSQVVPTYEGESKVTLSLPFLTDPPSASELAQYGFIDRRSLESLSTQVSRFVAGMESSELDEVNAVLEREFVGVPPDQRPHTPPRNPLEEAQDLCYEAFDSLGYRRVVLARQALEVSPDCADAYVLLAEAASTLEEQLDLYTAGVEAGRRVLGEDFFADPPEYPWASVAVRPFMRALQGLAWVQTERERIDEGIAGYQELLQLNPGDNQGIRYLLLPLLIVDDQDDAAKELVEEYADEETFWIYAKALLGFRAQGDVLGPRRAVRKAIRQDRYVADLLLGAEQIDDLVSEQEEDETFFVANTLQPAWDASEGALDWLAAQREATMHP